MNVNFIKQLVKIQGTVLDNYGMQRAFDWCERNDTFVKARVRERDYVYLTMYLYEHL